MSPRPAATTHVGIRLLPATPGGIAYPLMDDAASLRETLARLDATGVTVADLEVVAFRPETEIAALLRLLRDRRAAQSTKHILVAAYDPDLSPVQGSLWAAFCEAAAPYGLSADLEFMPWTYAPDLATANSIVRRQGSQMPACWWMRCISTGREARSTNSRCVPAHRLHYWQICDGPAVRPTTTEAMIHAARYERMFPGEGGIKSSSR